MVAFWGRFDNAFSKVTTWEAEDFFAAAAADESPFGLIPKGALIRAIFSIQDSPVPRLRHHCSPA